MVPGLVRPEPYPWGEAMTFTFDIASIVGKVRLMIPDKLADGHLFEDDEIQAFLDLESGNLKRATALALETTASDQALVLKVIRIQDLSTDGRAVAEALMKRAEVLRAQAADEEEAEDGGGFDIAQMAVDPFSYRDLRTR